MALASDDLKIKFTVPTQQPLIPGDETLLHVDCHTATIKREAIQALTMIFSVPYFLQFKGITSSAGYGEPSSYRNESGRLIVEFAPPKNSANISLDVTFFVMKQRLVPSGSASTSAIHVDVNYRRGPQECSQILHSYRDVEIVVYHPDCQDFGPLGISDGSVKESQLSVSSLFQTSSEIGGYEPYGAGLHALKHWAPARGFPSYDRRQYVQVDFREVKRIEMVSAQGHHEAKAPIRSLKFSVSNEGYRWKDYSEKNVEFYFTSGVLENPGNMLITALLKMPLEARWFRISPRFPDGFFGLRFEVYGCSVKKQPILYEDSSLGVESKEITDQQMNSSSYAGENCKAAKARLNLQNLQGAWCAKQPPTAEWLSVNLITSHVISAVSQSR
ncbi:neuropilin-1-like [Pocillopora damicornis]|uniref:neuropilin-1-like n=1 Tax=Pocillopora damicornis TaxID=46731 RepID=UPI000F558EA9|nr:neuropilin-1-like [Pocillopora damicornis]